MTIFLAIATGVLALVLGNLPWAGFGQLPGLGVLNLRVWTGVPWAIVPVSLYLWGYWQFISGRWGADKGAPMRRANLRANGLSPTVWLASLAAGTLGFITLLVLLAIAARLVTLPDAVPIITPPEMPVVTAVLLLAMQSVVAGVSEEAAFRGYMQSMIERQHGVVLAVLINGLLFGLLHFGNHPRDVLLMLPYYMAVSAVYGGLTWAADSILPAVVLHAAGDTVVLTRWWATGLPEWQVSATPPSLVWEHGADRILLVLVVAALVLVCGTGWSYIALRRAAGAARP